jgi:type IV pilus assembly protein PilE
MQPHTRAFSLLELVVAMAIAAALAMFAVPTYRTHVARAHRTDAASALYRAAQFAESPVYVDGAPLPNGVDQAPQSGKAVYRLRIFPANDTNGGYAIEAQPVDSGPMNDDACGTFVLDATGQKSNRGGISGAAAGTCWNSR